MEIEIFTICDYATDMNGKMVVVGTFDVVHSNAFPFQQPFGIGLRLRFSEKEYGDHNATIFMFDEERKELAKLDGNLTVNKPTIGSHSSLNLALNITGKFDRPGKYSFELHVDGEFRSGLSFYVVKS